MINIIKRKTLFTLTIGGAIIFHAPFLLGVLFTIGPAKVYTQDLVYASLIIYLLVYIILKNPQNFYRLRSSKIFILFFVWGLLSVLRGYFSYSYSAIGESRWYVLILLYYFYLLASMRKKDIIPFLKWILVFIAIMVVGHFFYFFLFGGNIEQIGRGAFRFINASETLLVAFVMVFMFLFYSKRQIRISKIAFFLLLFILASIIIVVQTRSVWLATAAGFIAIYFLTQRVTTKGIVPAILSILVLIVLFPAISWIIGDDITFNIKKSAQFLFDLEADPTGSWRLIGWQQELQAALRNPIFGQGLGGYSYWYTAKKWLQVAVHNGYIMYFSKFGLLGLLLLFSGLVFWYKEMNRYTKNENDPYYKVLGVALKVSVFMHLIFVTFYDFTIFFWILIGLGSLLVLNEDNKISDGVPENNAG